MRGVDIAMLCDEMSEEDLELFARDCAAQGQTEYADVYDLLLGADDESTRLPILDTPGFENLKDAAPGAIVASRLRRGAGAVKTGGGPCGPWSVTPLRSP